MARPAETSCVDDAHPVCLGERLAVDAGVALLDDPAPEEPVELVGEPYIVSVMNGFWASR